MNDVPATLIDFFETSGWKVVLFDLGRRVRRLGRHRFRRFERTLIPYPQPQRRHAFVGLLLSQSQRVDEQLLWFVQFPLDERGLLVQASRDYFLRRLFEAFGAKVRDGARPASVLEDNPFTFQPSVERLAVFRSRISRVVSRAPSQHYAHAQNYLHGALGFEQWSFVAFQGLADVAARLDLDDNESLILNALPHLPGEPFVALCTCLENERVSHSLAAEIASYTRAQMNRNGEDAAEFPNVLSAAIRGVSLARDTALSQALVAEALAHDKGGDIGVLAAIAGRAWEVLRESELREGFLRRLAAHDQQSFDAMVSDVAFVPAMREPLLQTLRSTAGARTELGQRAEAFFLSLR